MPPNIPGILVPFQLLIRPRLVVPSIVVKGVVTRMSSPTLNRDVTERYPPT